MTDPDPVTDSDSDPTAGPLIRVRVPRWIWWLTMALPVMFIGIGTVMLFDTMSFNSKAERLTATVISVADSSAPSSPDQTPNDSYRPTLTFTDAKGVRHQVLSHISSSEYDFAPGDKVEVLFNPASPRTVRIAGVFSEWGLPAILVALGWGSLLVLRIARRKFFLPVAAGAARRQQRPESKPDSRSRPAREPTVRR